MHCPTHPSPKLANLFVVSFGKTELEARIEDDAEENAKSEDAHTRNVEDADVVAAGLTAGIMIAGRGLEGEGKGEKRE